jgi:5-methylcytosine-specific restriction enzyme A
MPNRPQSHRPRGYRAATAVKADRDRHRTSAKERGYGSAWRKAAAAYRIANPLCVSCAGNGILRPAEVVDHVQAHCGNMTLFWDVNNWQSLCFTVVTRRNNARKPLSGQSAIRKYDGVKEMTEAELKTVLRQRWQEWLNGCITEGKANKILSSMMVDTMLEVAFCNKAHLDGGDAANKYYLECGKLYLKVRDALDTRVTDSEREPVKDARPTTH